MRWKSLKQKWAASWYYQQCGYASSEDSDHRPHEESLDP